MKDIHVVLLEPSSQKNLNQALFSLSFISDRVRDITLLGKNNTCSKLQATSFSKGIQYTTLFHETLERGLNEYIQKLSGEYVLFLHNQDFINSNINEISLHLQDNQHVMVSPYQVKDKVIQRPFLSKVSFLKQNNFFLKYPVPFGEAVLPLWLSRLNKSHILNTSGSFISQINKNVSATMYQKITMVEQYQMKTTSYLNKPSISVILANYNMSNYVDIALSSCFSQNHLPSQVLVMDDGSTDSSYKQLESWRYYPEFQLFNQGNSGKARALNNLLPYVETEFVLELDADDWLDPDAFLMIASQLQSISDDTAVLYGNLRKWKQTKSGDIKYKGTTKGKPVYTKEQLLSYLLPLGPRIYRTSSLKRNNGFPIIEFMEGRMYEDVVMLNKLLKNERLLYRDFTVYNVREHNLSITKKSRPKWSDFIKYLD
ncbi:glycosyl transferase family 2 [Priestia megaterium]|uniref:glycosyltransferase family 2 protein n=1 Tax=Priestia megaterium TaxID=1404 RepID=UPI000BF7914B|nr:glycosyltransferase family 2 protein [Priestia megaterium]PFB01115.1 glycosyl transferase family 2 [Priestia megaterium]